MFLTGLLIFSVALSAGASVPNRHYTITVRELPSQYDPQPLSLEQLRRDVIPTLDPRPFSEEFYLREFAAETPREPRHSKFAPLSNAASGLSKKMASLRRALARMLP